MARRDFYNFQKTKRAPNGRRRNKAKGLGVEKIKARVQNPVRGGAWVPFFFCKHSIKSATSQLFSKRQGTLARPLGNIPRRLFLLAGTGCALARISRMIREPCGGELARVQIGRFVGFPQKCEPRRLIFLPLNAQLPKKSVTL